jgi:hypothetical protein
MKHIIAATAALALLTSPALAGHHSHTSKTPSGSSDSKGDKKDNKQSKGDDSKGDDSNPLSSLLKNFSKLKPHD